MYLQQWITACEWAEGFGFAGTITTRTAGSQAN